MKNSSKAILLTAFVAFGIGMWMPQLSLRPVSAQTPTVLSGSYGYQTTQAVTPTSPSFTSSVGVMKFDGSGNVSIAQTFVGTNPAADATTVTVQADVPLKGKYTQNTDGTGVLSVDIGEAAAATFSFVITDGGANIMLVSTNGGNAITVGTARKQ